MIRAPRVPLSYNYTDAADALGISVAQLDKLVRQGDITPKYIASKPIFEATELLAWLASLPIERPAKKPTDNAPPPRGRA
jgi:hypothetical protein